jgi:hypothetical protein
MRVWNNALYFINGGTLYKTDGTTGGTVQLPMSYGEIYGANDNYIFTRQVVTMSTPPYYYYRYSKSDGTVAGTDTISAEIGGGASFERIGNTMFGIVQDGTYTSALWSSDGNTATKIFGQGYPASLHAMGDTLFYSNFGTGIGYELYYYTPTTTTGLNDARSGSSISGLYPNPASGFVYIESTHAGKVDITDISGRIILQTSVVAGRNHVNITGTETGLYFVRLTHGNETSVSRLLVK